MPITTRRDALLQARLHPLHRSEAAAELHPDAPAVRATIRRTRARFSPSPKARSRSTTWIHSAPCVGEALRHRHGVVPINGLPRRLALAQANDAAMSDVDGGKEVHYRSATGATGPGFPSRADAERRPGRRIRSAAAEQPVALARKSARSAVADRRAVAQLDPAGVLGHAVHPELVVQMRAGGEAGGADVADDLALLHPRAGANARAKPRRCP